MFQSKVDSCLGFKLRGKKFGRYIMSSGFEQRAEPKVKLSLKNNQFWQFVWVQNHLEFELVQNEKENENVMLLCHEVMSIYLKSRTNLL